jgi:hypothetical protein
MAATMDHATRDRTSSLRQGEGEELADLRVRQPIPYFIDASALARSRPADRIKASKALPASSASVRS